MPRTEESWFLYFNRDKSQATLQLSNGAVIMTLDAPYDNGKLGHEELKAAFEANVRKAAAGQRMFAALTKLASAARKAGIPVDDPAIKDAFTALSLADPTIYKVTHDGVERFTGTHHECWIHIHKSQGQSVDYATKHGGWAIAPAAAEPEAEAEPAALAGP